MSLKQIRDQIFEQAEAAREQLRSFWAGLAPRERLILSVASGLLGLVLISFSAKQIGSLFLSSDFDLEQNLEDARRIQSLVAELKNGRFQARRYDRLKEQRPASFQIESFLATQAQTFGLQIREVRPRRINSANAAQSNEKLFEVDIAKGASLDASLRFLESVEEVIGVRLVELRIRPEFEDASQLDVSFVVALKENL